MAAKRLFFLVFLVTFSAALGFPDPQEAATGGGGGLNKDGGTDKCNAVQFQEWSQDVDACFTAAEQELSELLSSLNFNKAEVKKTFCDSIAGKVDCMAELSNRCLDETQKKNLRINTLADDFKRAYNLSETLGPDTITGCSVLLRHQKEVVERLAGDGDKCSFAEYEGNTRSWKKCLSDAVETREFRLSLLSISGDKSNFFSNVVCSFSRQLSEVCTPIFVRCLSPEKRDQILALDLERMKDLEASAQDLIPFFSFETSCRDFQGDEGSGLRAEMAGMVRRRGGAGFSSPRSHN